MFYGQTPTALTFDEQLQSIPEPQRSDYQILVDERVDEIVHKTMSKFRDHMWKEMTEERLNFAIMNQKQKEAFDKVQQEHEE